MFESGEEPEVTKGLVLMNDLVVPCIPVLLAHDADRDLMAVEDMRNRWCSYLGQEMEGRFPGGDCPLVICSHGIRTRVWLFCLQPRRLRVPMRVCRF